ncbi:MAG: hypothetical protein CMM49_01430 [Rhodospirillaceae bacterium]|nr:hypothetical protein [Rhodospirillaceae bacterium]
MFNRFTKILSNLTNLTYKLLLVLILSTFISSCSSSRLPSLSDVPDWAKPKTTINKIKGIFSKEDDND